MNTIQGFKNLLHRSLLIDESIQPLLRRGEEYRKVTQTIIDYFQLVFRNYELYSINYEKILFDFHEELERLVIDIPQFYNQFIILFRSMNSQTCSFSTIINNSMKQFTTLCSSSLIQFSNLILTFQQCIRSYQSNELILFEQSKKYFRTHRNMIAAIQAYKNSFTDVRLIYNKQEKAKRFGFGENTMKTLNQDLAIINDNTEQLNNKKQAIIKNYANIQIQLRKTLKIIGDKQVLQIKKFVGEFCKMYKNIITCLAQRKFTLQKIPLINFFSTINNFKDQQLYNCAIDKDSCKIFPTFLVYYSQLKEEINFQKIFNTYYKQVVERAQQRKTLNRKINEFVMTYFKIYQKASHSGLKQILIVFEKIKKRISQVFGNRLVSFLKSLSSIFQLSIGINQKLLKRIQPRLKQIQSSIQQQAKLLDLMIKQLKIEKQKKKEDEMQQNRKKEQQKKVEYLKHIIQTFNNKMIQNYDQLKLNLSGLVLDLSLSTNQFYSLCCQYQQLYFGQDQYEKNRKKYQIDIQTTLKKETEFFQEINFGTLLKQEGKVIFDGQFNKIEEFKKMKKPIQGDLEKPFQSEDSKNQQIVVDQQKKQGKRKNSDTKYEQFLSNKVVLQQNQRMIKSFSCGLADKIILMGRLFITTHQLCFYSKFNSNTVFFGGTFLQIPKKDIKKIQKRFNAIFFDNSISVTTINGQVFLTSFFSRNEAFDLICNHLQINVQELIFQQKQQIIPQISQIIQQDDMNTQALSQRSLQLDKQLSVFPYNVIFQGQFSSPGLSALKMFKLFDSGLPLVINRRSYPSFNYYLRQMLDHKQIQIGDWTPNIYNYLNSVNIKSNTPLVVKRKLFALVPVTGTNLPFMPKQARSDQEQKMLFYSKNKFVLQSTVQNSGVPYGDTFNIKIRKTTESLSADKCKVTVELYVNFVQNSIVKSLIQSKTISECRLSMVKLQEEINKFLKKLQKGKNNIQTSANKQQQLVNNDQQLRSIQEKYQKLHKKVISQEKHTAKILRVTIASVILNIILLIILVL